MTSHLLRTGLFFLLILRAGHQHAQLLPQTHVVEAYNCSCSEGQKKVNSIQLGVRLDGSNTIHTALRTLVGCGRIVVIVDGERFPMRLNLANARDNIARLEPIEMAMNISELEKKFRKTPNYAAMDPSMEEGARPNIVILQGAGMSKQKRGLSYATLHALHKGALLRYAFTMNAQNETDIDFDRLMGGPVWMEQGKDHLAGLITGMNQANGGVEFVVTGLANILDKSQYMPYHAYLATFSAEIGDCGPKQIYWDGFGTYRYKQRERPDYKRISADEKWDKALRTALLRIREHMADSIPAKGNNQIGAASLCVFVNDLENVYLAFADQASSTDKENWPVLPRFVKAYSSVHCKQRRYNDSELMRDIIDLNFWTEQIGSEELRLLYELGYDWNAFEGFVKKYFMLSQVSGVRKRYDELMSRAMELEEPCTQRLMLDELNALVESWGRYVGETTDPHYAQLLQYRKELSVKRDQHIDRRLRALEADSSDGAGLLQAIESDSCLSDAERLQLLKAARNRTVDKEKKDMEYGIDVVEDLRTTISSSFGEDALANVMTRVFRVEDGIGIELTIRGGGSILNKRLHGHSGAASDTTTVYRSGFPLGSVGDTLSGIIAQVFWERMCADYSSRKWAYRTESLTVTGMADGVPVRSNLHIAEPCREVIMQQGIKDPNEQLAFARAWSLREQISLGDRCGLFDLLAPTIAHKTHRARGGEYRGVAMSAVMKRL